MGIFKKTFPCNEYILRTGLHGPDQAIGCFAIGNTLHRLGRGPRGDENAWRNLGGGNRRWHEGEAEVGATGGSESFCNS